MKRLVIFLVLGPPIGMLVTMVTTSLLTGGSGWETVAVVVSTANLPVTQMFMAGGLLVAYTIGAIPSAIACATDAALSTRRRSVRVLATTLVGFCTYMAMIVMLKSGASTGLLLALGLSAAIPAAVCSWLSGLPFTKRPASQIS